MNTQVVLLAAGQSSRIHPISCKIFLKFLGKELIVHQFEHLIETGIKKIIVVGNKNNIAQIKKIIKTPQNITVDFAIQKNLDEGIMGGVLASQPFLDMEKPLFLVSSNDYVEKKLFKKVIEQATKSSAQTFIAGKVVENYFPGGYLELNQKQKIKTIVEKPQEGKEPSNLVALLIQLFKKPQNLLKAYQKLSAQDVDAHEQALQNLFNQEQNAEIVEHQGFWQAIKYPFHVLSLMNHFLENMDKTFIHSQAEISKNAVIKGNCYLSEGVKILDYAVLQGPVFIDKSSIIGNHALVRRSSVGQNCVIGHTSEICRSYLADYVWTHQNFVGDSVFDQNVSLGAGTRTGNLRLDEKNICVNIKKDKIDSCCSKLGAFIGSNVRIGINCSLMPGIKIAGNSFLTAGLIVNQDIPENSFVSGQNGINICSNKKIIPKRGFFQQ